jgi:uncharacterized membrane protein
MLQGTKLGRIISPVVACFAVGVGLGNGTEWTLGEEVFKPLSAITIVMAIPLLLMTTDFKAWILRSGPALKAITVAVVGVVLSMFVVKILLGHLHHDSAIILAMIGACLIGSSVNMSAVGISLNADSEVFTLVLTADILCGALFFLYLIGLAPLLYRWWLPGEVQRENAAADLFEHSRGSVFQWKKAAFWKDLLAAFSLAISCGAAAAGFTMLLSGGVFREDVFLIMLTIAGIAVGMFSEKVRSIRTADASGQYFLLVFSFAMGWRADFSAILGASQSVLLMVGMAYIFTALIQLLLFKIFKISADAAVMATAGTVFSPVFIGQVAAALNNKQVIITGMVTAILGYALGNFFGLFFFRVLTLLT